MLIITTGSVQETAAGQIPLPKLSSHRQAHSTHTESEPSYAADGGSDSNAQPMQREASANEGGAGQDSWQNDDDGVDRDFDESSELDIDSLAAFRQPGMYPYLSGLTSTFP